MSSVYANNILHYPNPFLFSHIFFTLDDECGRKRRIRNNSLQRIGPTALMHPVILISNHETSMWDNAQGWFNEDKYAKYLKKLG